MWSSTAIHWAGILEAVCDTIHSQTSSALLLRHRPVACGAGLSDDADLYNTNLKLAQAVMSSGRDSPVAALAMAVAQSIPIWGCCPSKTTFRWPMLSSTAIHLAGILEAVCDTIHYRTSFALLLRQRPVACGDGLSDDVDFYNISGKLLANG